MGHHQIRSLCQTQQITWGRCSFFDWNTLGGAYYFEETVLGITVNGFSASKLLL